MTAARARHSGFTASEHARSRTLAAGTAGRAPIPPGERPRPQASGITLAARLGPV